jgi:hypothetical protein
MFKKLFIYIFIGFLQLSINLIDVYATETVNNRDTKTISQTLQIIENKKSKDEKPIVKHSIHILDKKNETQEVKTETKNPAVEQTLETDIKTDNIKSLLAPLSVEAGIKIPALQYYKGQKSLMYSEEHFIKIVEILDGLEKGIRHGQTHASQDSKQDKQAAIDSFDDYMISIYLNSILYISDDLWAVWANDQKIIKKNDEDKDIRVLSVSPRKVKFLWSISKTKWDIINANRKISEKNYNIQDDKVELKFTLEPNQSFMLFSNKIIEGRIKQERPLESKTIILDQKIDINNNETKKESRVDRANRSLYEFNLPIDRQ